MKNKSNKIKIIFNNKKKIFLDTLLNFIKSVERLKVCLLKVSRVGIIWKTREKRSECLQQFIYSTANG
jgi:hypothetical protein